MRDFFLIGIKGIEKPSFPFPTHFKDEKHYNTFINDFEVFPIRKFKKWISVKDAFKKIFKILKNEMIMP